MQSAVDILKKAIDNEIRAKVFYGRASEIAGDGEAQMVLLELVGMEDGHARLLVDRFDDVFAAAGFDAAGYVARREGETESVLDTEETRILEEKDLRAALKFAIGMEIEARDGYLALREKVDPEEQKALLSDLAAEEQKHHDMLSKTLVDMDIPPEERTPLG